MLGTAVQLLTSSNKRVLDSVLTCMGAGLDL